MITMLLIVSGFEISANAATFPVTNGNDSGAGSLRQALLDASNVPGDDAIVFQNGSGIVTLTTGELLINSNVTISGTVADPGIITRGTADGIPGFVFSVWPRG